MPSTRVVPTSVGHADFSYFENIEAGALFLDADCIRHDDATSIAEAAESNVLWMKTDLKRKDDQSAAISLESGRVKYFSDQAEVIVVHQRNMWEGWT